MCNNNVYARHVRIFKLKVRLWRKMKEGRRAVRLPALSLVLTQCLVWPDLSNWNNIQVGRWMEGRLDSVHLKKL